MTIPDWAKDENDPPATMWEKKQKDEDDAEPIDEESEEYEDDLGDEEYEDEDEEESEDYEEQEESDEAEDEDDIEPIDEAPAPVMTARLDEIIPEEPSDDEDTQDLTSLNSEKGIEVPTTPENPVKSRSTGKMDKIVDGTFGKFHDWLNGTDERPLPLFSMRAKFRRWRLIRFHNHVWLRTMSWDRSKMEYSIHEDLIPRKNLPRSAVHCTNEKNVYFDKLFDVPYEPWKDNGFGAMNAYLYMKDTSIDEALLLLWKGPGMNMRTMAIIGIVAVAAVFYLIFMMQG